MHSHDGSRITVASARYLRLTVNGNSSDAASSVTQSVELGVKFQVKVTGTKAPYHAPESSRTLSGP